MAWFGRQIEAPPIEAGPTAFVLWLARHEHGVTTADLDDAVDQDLKIVGDESDDFVLAIADRYGEWVRHWPWERFLCFNEGLSILAPAIAVWELLRLPWRNTAFPSKSNFKRLTLRHIAAVLEKGEWFEP